MELFKKLFTKADDAVSRIQRDSKVQGWLDAIGEAEKREKTWRDQASRVVDLYEQERAASESGGTADFNILYANTETLAPAVYNNMPRPVVKRKTDKNNPVAIAAAQVLKATLTYLTDTADSRYAAFDDLQKSAVLEALVPGRGLVRFAYDADIQEVPPAAEGQPPSRRVVFETVCGDAVPWNRVVYGYAKQWHDIPWMAFEHFMTREECVKNFGEARGAKIKLSHSASEDKDGEKSTPANSDGVKFAHVWEIWDKRTKKVCFVSEGYASFLDEEDDPLELEGFFPTPRPIGFATRIKSLVPQTLYLLYETQAKELDDVTRRIGHIVRALKIRGFYDGTLEGLDDLLKSPENTLLPARNVAAMQQGQTLEKSIWFMPIEQLVAVLQQLYTNRQQIIGVIHQITGIADIMRGASAASETLGAQKMKEAWGTMRLKRMQKEVQRFTRDCYRLQAELAAKHFSQETFQQMTGIQLPTQADQQQAQTALQQIQMQGAQMQAAGQQPDPALAQQGQRFQQVLSAPSWESVVKFLRNDTLRNYLIDIETNSTIDIEATEDKAELAEMMNSMAQVLNGIFPMVEKGVFPFEAAKALTLTIIQKFRLGDEVEEYFRSMQQPPAKADPTQQKVEAEMKRDQQKFQLEQQRESAKLQSEQELSAMEAQNRREELNFQREELQMKMTFARAKFQQDMAMLQVKAAMPPAPAPANPSAGA